MKTKTLFSAILLMAAAIQLHAQQPDADNPAMKAWMAYATPGPQQQMMAKSAGDWKAEVTQWMDPNQQPMKSQATVHNEMILGGRYLTTHYNSSMNGMPFEGMGTVAYDNGTKMYSSSWVDNMGTGMMYMKGMPAADGKSIEFKGTVFDPMIGKETTMRQVNSFIDDNHQKIEFYESMNGKDMKVMEINLSR